MKHIYKTSRTFKNGEDLNRLAYINAANNMGAIEIEEDFDQDYDIVYVYAEFEKEIELRAFLFYVRNVLGLIKTE